MADVEDELERLDRARALIEQANLTPGAAVDRDINRLFRSFYVFARNTAELRDTIIEEQRLENALLVRHEEIDRVLDEIDRLLHNFLAASFTLISHTQKLRARYLSDEMNAEYDRRNPVHRPVCRLVKEVRHSAQHSRLPLIRQNLSIQLDRGKLTGGRATFAVDVSYLKTLSKLSASVRDHFIEKAETEGSIALLEIVLEYAETTFGFFRWFMSAVETSQMAALAQTAELRRAARVLATSTSSTEAEHARPSDQRGPQVDNG